MQIRNNQNRGEINCVREGNQVITFLVNSLQRYTKYMKTDINVNKSHNIYIEFICMQQISNSIY